MVEWFRNHAKLPTPHPRGMHLLRLPWKRDWPIGHDLRNSRSLVYAWLPHMCAIVVEKRVARHSHSPNSFLSSTLILLALGFSALSYPSLVSLTLSVATKMIFSNVTSMSIKKFCFQKKFWCMYIKDLHNIYSQFNFSLVKKILNLRKETYILQ